MNDFYVAVWHFVVFVFLHYANKTLGKRDANCVDSMTRIISVSGNTSSSSLTKRYIRESFAVYKPAVAELTADLSAMANQIHGKRDTPNGG